MGEHCAGVVFSGTGSDGSYGVQAIREAGSIAIAQDAATAKYDGMPVSAVQTGCIEPTLPPEQIGVRLSKILASPRNFDQLRRLIERPSKMTDLFQILLARINVDFRDYEETPSRGGSTAAWLLWTSKIRTATSPITRPSAKKLRRSTGTCRSRSPGFSATKSSLSSCAESSRPLFRATILANFGCG